MIADCVRGKGDQIVPVWIKVEDFRADIARSESRPKYTGLYNISIISYSMDLYEPQPNNKICAGHLTE